MSSSKGESAYIASPSARMYPKSTYRTSHTNSDSANRSPRYTSSTTRNNNLYENANPSFNSSSDYILESSRNEMSQPEAQARSRDVNRLDGSRLASTSSSNRANSAKRLSSSIQKRLLGRITSPTASRFTTNVDRKSPRGSVTDSVTSGRDKNSSREELLASKSGNCTWSDKLKSSSIIHEIGYSSASRLKSSPNHSYLEKHFVNDSGDDGYTDSSRIWRTYASNIEKCDNSSFEKNKDKKNPPDLSNNNESQKSELIDCPICQKIVSSLTEHLGRNFTSECGQKYADIMYAPVSKTTSISKVDNSNSSSFDQPNNGSFSSNVNNSSNTSPIQANCNTIHSEVTSPTVEYVDRSFTKHEREGHFLTAYMAASERSQQSYGGKYACTTICMEAALYFLHHEEKGYYPISVSKLEDILKSGCLIDPQQGYLSFSQIYNSIDRYKQNLMEISKLQEIANGKSFQHALNILKQLSFEKKSRVCAILTKPPQSILVGSVMTPENDFQGFFVFDSHMRITDSKLHGAQFLYLPTYEDALVFLVEWMFPMNQDQNSNLQYSMFDMTYVIQTKNSVWKPFNIDDDDSILSPLVHTNQIQKENEKLKMQLQEQTARLVDLQVKYEALQEDNIALGRRLEDHEKRNQSLMHTLRELFQMYERNI